MDATVVVAAALPSLPHRRLGQERGYRVVDADTHLDVVVPQVANLPVLNRRLTKVADDAVASFRRTLRKEADRGPGRYHALTVGWQLLGRSKETVGLQLWLAEQHGLSITIDRATLWYHVPTATVLDLPDLFTPAGWPAVERGVVSALRGHQRATAARAALHADRRKRGNGPTFGFTGEGDLLVTFAAHTLASNAEPVTVWVAAGPLDLRLSTAGRAAAASVGQGEGTTTVAPERVDCAKRKCVALTFDDGPGPYTAELVSVLQHHQVRATFFLVGDRVRQAPDLVALVDAAGMEVGNHSSHHDELTFRTAQQVRDDLRATNQAISAVTGRRPVLLRPPYGSRNAAVDTVSKQLRLAEVLWDVDTLDWRYPDPARVRRAAVAPTRAGSIILLHDIHRTTVNAVPGIVADLQRRGYTLVTVSELLPDPPAPGRVYRRQPVPASR